METVAPVSHAEHQAALAENRQLKERLSALEFQLDELKRLVFGARSERFVPAEPAPGAPTLFDASVTAVAAEPQTKTITVTLPQKKKNEEHPGRNPLPAHLPREVTVLEPVESTEGMTVIGEDVTEILDYTQGKLFVRRYVRPKYALPRGAGILTAALPEQPIPRSMVGSGLLSHVIISKFVDSLPVYRQLEIFKREGVELSPATVSGWIEGACGLLEPLYDNLTKQVLASSYLQVDETRLQVLDGKEKGKSHRGWIWGYHCPPQGLVLFDYAEGRDKENPSHHLRKFKGYLQTDGYGVYDGFGNLPGITLASCWAHARREIFESKDYDAPRADHALREIGKLYDLERSIKGLSAAGRLAERTEKALPILAALHAWMEKAHREVLPQSPFGKALAYSLKRWSRLETYCLAGEVEIDSNLLENAIRKISLGRKNFLFAGSHEGAKRVAMLYSFMGSCKKNSVEPLTWLQKTLDIIPSWPANRLNELLPNYRPEQN